jgi:signal peptidase I
VELEPEKMANEHISPPSDTIRSTPPTRETAASEPRPGGLAVAWRWFRGKKTDPKTPAPPTDSLREIVETIVFVVVLVLLLKSFAAEAFVIPTGSMAETLLGYQKFVTCPKCQHEFPVNCSQEADPPDGNHPVYTRGCVCPNCREVINFDEAARNNPKWSDPSCASGDRVLVAKFLYDFKRPDRLDVVVFKYPGDDSRYITGPQKNHVPMNYIKRLIGLPGETIAIYAGNLYYVTPLTGPSYPEDQQLPLDELRKPSAMHENNERAQELFRTGNFQIIRKPPDVLLAMKRLVYDNDKPASDLTGKEWQRWVPADESAWEKSGANGFRHPARVGPGIDWLRYRNVLRTSGTKPVLITDFMGYNTWMSHGGGHTHPKANWVGDLLLECEVRVEKAEGELRLELSKGEDRFRAIFDLASGFCRLTRESDADLGHEVELEKKDAKLKKGTYKLRFANCDERLTVWVDNRLIFGDGVTYSYPKGHVVAPTSNDLEPASIGVSGGAVSIGQIKLWRDTYHTLDASRADAAEPSDWGDPRTWDSLRKLDVKTLYVQPGHFLCMGDNSPESSDGRSWGLVPERLMLGRALMVYYPFSRAGRIR